MGQDLIEDIERRIEEHRLFTSGETIVAAVSGGPDSVALLHVLHRLAPRNEWKLSAAHVNHSLRGEESDEDEAFVRKLCDRLGVPLYTRRVDVKSQLDQYGRNLQAAARALRFQTLREAAEERGAATVVLGHHGDDQAETVLMRLLRGTGPGGLSGIRPVSHVNGMRLVRPLLWVTKQELERYNEEHELESRFDSSNASRYYFRNVVRLDILPYLLRHHSGAADSLRRVAEMSAAEDDYLDKAARERIAGFERGDNGIVRAAREQFASVHIALQRRMIKIILNSLNLGDLWVDFAKIERIREAIAADVPTTTTLRVSETVIFRRSYEQLEWVVGEETVPQAYALEIDVGQDGSVELPELDARLQWEVVPAANSMPASAQDRNVAWFDAAEVGGSVVIRNRRSGDRIEPFGLNGTRKVKDMFIDGKLPRHRRERWPIVTGREGELLWVPGFRRSRHALVNPRTRTALVMRLILLDGNES